MNISFLEKFPRELMRFNSRFSIGETHIRGREILDESFYRWRYSDLEHVEPLRHFLLRGQLELRSPNCFFEPGYYIKRHQSECNEKLNDLESFPVGHFLSCTCFTCPSPLLAIDSVHDTDGTRRALYLSIVTHSQSADNYATSHFSPKRYGHSTISDLPYKFKLFENENSKSISSLAHYAICCSRADSLFLARDPSGYFDNELVNHSITQAGQVCLDVTPLSWYMDNYSSALITDQIVNTHKFLPVTTICRVLTSGNQAFTLEKSLMKLLNHSPMGEIAACRHENATRKRVSVLSIHMSSPEYNALSLGFLELDHLLRKELEILVLDNASEPRDWQRAYGYLAPNIDRALRVDKRVSFGEANNLMSEVASGDYLLFLNSDAYILPSTVLRLAKHLDENPETVAVAPTLYYPDGRVQEMGGLWFEDGSTVQFGKGASRLPELNELRIDSSFSGVYRSASCLLVRATTFGLVGGFSPHYDPAYFEDTDLCAKLSRHGSIDSLVDLRCVHLEGATNNRPEVLEHKQDLISANRATFSRRVKRLLTEGASSFDNFEFTPSRSSSQLDFLLTSPYSLIVGGGEKYLLELARLLSGFGSVAMSFSTQISRFRLLAICEELGIDRFPSQLITTEQAKNLQPRIHVAMGNSALPPIEGLGVRSVYHCQFPFNQLLPPSDVELSRINSYDFAVVNSKFTAKNLEQSAQYWKSRTKVVAPPVTLDSEFGSLLTSSADINNQVRILNIGRFFSDGHRKNQHLLVVGLAKLLQRIPNAHLTLIGSVSGDQSSVNYLNLVRQMSIGLPVEIITNPSRLDVLDELTRSSIYWHGTGLDVAANKPEGMEHFGISVIEACQAGLFPFAHDSGGPAEIFAEISPFSLYRTIDDLVERTAHHALNRVQSESWGNLKEFSMQFNRAEFDKKWTALLGLNTQLQ